MTFYFKILTLYGPKNIFSLYHPFFSERHLKPPRAQPLGVYGRILEGPDSWKAENTGILEESGQKWPFSRFKTQKFEKVNNMKLFKPNFFYRVSYFCVKFEEARLFKKIEVRAEFNYFNTTFS